MTRLYFILLTILLTTIQSFSQLKIDTIDYTFDFKNIEYKLLKMTNTAGTTNIKFNCLETLFYIGNCNEYKHQFAPHGIICNNSDTIAMLSFYIPKGASKPYSGKNIVIIHINRTNNIIKAIQRQKENATVSFKIYKWTKYQIILKEITNNNRDRIYILQSK